MPNKEIDLRIERLKTVKSAYILEANASMARGLEAVAMELFLKAGELELELANLFQSRNDSRNAQVSFLSAGSCLLRAKQYRNARKWLESAAEQFPEARELIAQCEGKDDVPLSAATPGLQALIGLLVKKKVIEEGEWAEALAGH
jgi:tetratricopeptide (TPR) repeat protein